MQRLRSMADSKGIALIEDACEAIGSEVGGKKAGTLGDVGAFAFYPNKQITTGEGGMLVTQRSKTCGTRAQNAESGP